jgi:hypothetical protein
MHVLEMSAEAEQPAESPVPDAAGEIGIAVSKSNCLYSACSMVDRDPEADVWS